METAQQSHHLMKRVIDSKTPQECVRTVASPKPNQVGTVLLYGIPIVSLYIESQERLCLAQISNTLLKQFSYNEIHNRRVALGITCVQCTPVQLEILRRAGAMPVSSRRCGMITRREAERLCKSFLGDNAPPRLPEDFAFSVHHECAWGCRGSFLPSRYNSSRAKCIKCSYCGLFFSPNKFIFHSHRIGPGDKYVQPDAANFNSWRRHMKLSGNPPEEIIHAWEDVKAMFNGGTRKRLMTNSPSSRQSASSPKRIKETQISPPLIHAAAAAAVVSAAATVNVNQFPIRPVNIHHPTSPSTTNPAPRIPNLGAELTLPFSRTFMMDYMWHAQNKSSTFQFPNYTLPWIKRPASLLFTQQTTNGPAANNEDTTSPAFNNHNQSCTSNGTTIGSTETETKTIPFYNNSAFKPVINQARKTFPTAAAALAIGAIIDDDQRTCSRNSKEDCGTIKESLSSDDEMVDIETTEEEHQDNNITCMKFKGDERSISIKLPESPPIEIENSSDMAWEGFMKKENNVRTIGVNMRSTTPVPSLLSHSPSSSLASDHQRCTTISPVSPDATISTINPLPISIRQNNLSIEQLTSSTTPSSSSSTSSSTAAAAAAAVAIAALGHTSNNININNNNNNSGGVNIQNNNCSSIILSSSSSSSTTTTTQLTQNNRTGLCNNNNNSNNSNNNNNNSSSHNNSNSNNNIINNTISNHNGHEFWSVARFSFDRPEYRIPLYRHDITKHFQNFRHGETTTQTNGVG